MRTAGGWLLVGWLVAALLLGMDRRLPEFLAGAVPGSLLVLGVGALVRQQLAPLARQPAQPPGSATGSPTSYASRSPP
jgi:hypothetical protein